MNVYPRQCLESTVWSSRFWYVRCARLRCNSIIEVERIETNDGHEYQYIQDTIVISYDDTSFAVCGAKCITGAAKRIAP